MKRIVCFTCPKLILIFICRSLFGVLLSIVPAFLFKDRLYTFIFFICIEILIVVSLLCVWKRSLFRAWILVSVDETGISNRYCKLSWNDIQYCGFDYLQHQVYGLFLSFELGRMFCFSRKEDQCSFSKSSLNDVVFVPYNKKVIEMIKKYAPNLSEDLDLNNES